MSSWSRGSRAADKPVDPYWSLWGKLKSRVRKDHEAGEMPDVGGGVVGEAGITYYENRAPLKLPKRGIAVDYDGKSLLILGREKPVNGDHHAVNALRKLDNDDGYFARTTNGQQP